MKQCVEGEELGDTGYTLRLLDPFNLNFEDSKSAAKIVLKCFATESLNRYRNGKLYWYGPDIEMTPERVKAHQLLAASRARFFHLNMLNHNNVSYGVYDDNKRMVGFIVWELPTHMYGYGYSRLGRPNYQYWYLVFRNKAAKSYHDLVDWWSFLGKGEHPYKNARNSGYFEKEAREEAHFFKDANDEKLSQLTFSELKDAQYPRERQLQLDWLMIDPDFQQKGIGKQLFHQTLDKIPNQDTIFKYHDRTSRGPQILSVRATPIGAYLYRKLGFIDKPGPFRFQTGGFDFTNYHMQMLRNVDN